VGRSRVSGGGTILGKGNEEDCWGSGRKHRNLPQNHQTKTSLEERQHSIGDKRSVKKAQPFCVTHNTFTRVDKSSTNKGVQYSIRENIVEEKGYVTKKDGIAIDRVLETARASCVGKSVEVQKTEDRPKERVRGSGGNLERREDKADIKLRDRSPVWPSESIATTPLEWITDTWHAQDPSSVQCRAVKHFVWHLSAVLQCAVQYFPSIFCTVTDREDSVVPIPRGWAKSQKQQRKQDIECWKMGWVEAGKVQTMDQPCLMEGKEKEEEEDSEEEESSEESEWESCLESEEEEEDSSDSGLGSLKSERRHSKSCEYDTRDARLDARGPRDSRPVRPFDKKELEIAGVCREWVERITNQNDKIVRELQEDYGKLLPRVIIKYGSSKEENKILRVVGDTDKEGRPHGEVEIYYTNGDYFWGDCVHGVKEGLASLVLTNGDSLLGRFKAGRLEGLVTETLCFCDRDNVTREVVYKRGVRHGFYREFGPSTQPGVKEFWALGRYEQGLKIGTHWKWTPGNGFLVGCLDDENRSQGEEIVYLYPDLTTTICGSFDQGRLTRGHLSRLVGHTSKFGIPVPHTKPVPGSPIISYDLSTTFRISKNPLESDPYETRYIYVKESQTPGAGEGLWAKTLIRKGQLAAIFNGLRQRHIWGAKTTPRVWSDYRISCGKDVDLDIGKSQESLSNYHASLAHKTCHSFHPNTNFNSFWHPKFGPCMSVITKRDIQPGEELFVSYNYQLETAPEWYQALWFSHLRDDEGMTEPEIYNWCLRHQKKTGALLRMPSPPRDSERYIPCGVCSSHVGSNVPAIECTTCSLWYHMHCTEISLDVATEENFSWTCSSCDRNHY